jgi:hypothetical protein
MMANGVAALGEVWHRGFMEEAWVRVFSIDGVVVVTLSACLWSWRPLAQTLGGAGHRLLC